MPKQVTNYSLLLSCPSDVKDEIETINETVTNFNRMYGGVNNANISIKHWSKDSFPQLGDSPQVLLNKQFILDCDAVVAVFWTKFGTPTDKYESGTEEEIEELLKSGKQVFLYFSDCPKQPSLIDNEQYQKIIEYREKNKNRGIYCTYSDIDEFKKLFLNHLSLYFIDLITNGNISTKSIGSKLIINGVNNGKILDKIILQRRNYLEMQFLQEIKVSIFNLFKQIKDIKLPFKEEENLQNKNTNPNHQELSKLMKVPALNLGGSYKAIKAVIDEDNKNIIIRYSSYNNMDIETDTFFYLGELTKRPKMSFSNSGVYQSYELEGNEEEKRKYKLINKLYLTISKYEQYKEYYSILDSRFYVQLALSNLGKSFDEDVDVKIYFNKNTICTKEGIPVPGDLIIENINKGFNRIFRPDKTIDINLYNNYPAKFSIPNISIYKNTSRNNIQEYQANIDTTFCYDYFQNEEYDVISYNQKYIKQFNNIYFPSIIVFNNKPDKLHYEITSKYSSEIMKGELIIKEND